MLSSPFIWLDSIEEGPASRSVLDKAFPKLLTAFDSTQA